MRLLIRHNKNGFYALSTSINAKGHVQVPISSLGGVFEGLGNTISNLALNDSADRDSVGLFAELNNVGFGIVRDIGLSSVSVVGEGTQQDIGVLVWRNLNGTIANSYATGEISASGAQSIVGGLGISQTGTVQQSYANVAVSAVGTSSVTGGLIGEIDGTCCRDDVDQSYSLGSVSGGDNALAGGLVGKSFGGKITNSYATGISEGGNNALLGGLVGANFDRPQDQAVPIVASSYSTGAISDGAGATIGGFIGQDVSDSQITNGYWDLDTSGISNPHQGAGNIPDDPGITGLSDAQLKSGLPAGFDPTIWTQNAKINNGYPYLIDNPPQR